MWDERAVGGCGLADPEGLAAGVDGLEVEGIGGFGGDGAEAEGRVVAAGFNWAAESQGEQCQEERSGGDHLEYSETLFGEWEVEIWVEVVGFCEMRNWIAVDDEQNYEECSSIFISHPGSSYSILKRVTVRLPSEPSTTSMEGRSCFRMWNDQSAEESY